MDRQQFETIFTSSAFMITAVLTLFNAVMLSNALGDAGRGAVAAAFGNTLVLGWAFQVGVPNAAAYFAKDIDMRKVMMSAWTMTVVIALPLALVLIPFYMWQLDGESFVEGGDSLRRWYIAFVAVNLLNGPFLSAVFWLRGIGNTIRFNVLLALPQLLITLGYAVLFVSGNMTVNNALTSTMVMMLTGWIIGLTVTNGWPGRGFSRVAYEKIRSFALRAWIGNLSFFVSLRVDQMLLVGFVPLAELGVYAVAAALSTLSSPIARGVAQAALPFIRNASSDEERLVRVRNATMYVAGASLGTLVAIGVTARWLVPFVFGEDFTDSVRLLLILLPGAFATDVTHVYTTTLQSFNRPEDTSKAQIMAAVTTAIGLLALLPSYGTTGAAITTSVSYWVALLASIYFWRRLKRKVERGEVTGHTERIEETVS